MYTFCISALFSIVFKGVADGPLYFPVLTAVVDRPIYSTVITAVVEGERFNI